MGARADASGVVRNAAEGIEFGSITHHPDGIPHGPHPGRAEASIGAKETNELAVMMDSFRPLKVASSVSV